MTSAGAKYTNELPCTNGRRVPKNECNSVEMPDTSSIVETTFAVSFCIMKEQIDLSNNVNLCNPFSKMK